MRGVAARRLAVEVLAKVEVDNAYANLALNSAFDKKPPLAERDRAFVTFLVHGVLRHRDELDDEIAAVSLQALPKMKPMLRNLLRIAFYQLKYADDIPVSAVLNTSTEIGKMAGHAGIGKFVTGILRNYVRKRDSASGSGGGTPPVQAASGSGTPPVQATALAKQFSVPEWLVVRWLNRRGETQTIKLLEYSQSIPELVIRACESGIETQALIRLLTGHGIKLRQGELVPSCLIIEERGKYKGPLEKIPGYTDGLFVVQDEAAAFASVVVDSKPGETIVDLCAAPGGKAIHMAEMMENRGRVIAVDIHPGRLELLKKTRQRVGLTNVEAVAADGTIYQPEAKVDRVLLDAPCTGTGVINRRTDLRFKRQQPDLSALVLLQRKLLENAARMLKTGGILIYSTCSIEPEENEENLHWFLSTFQNFKPTPLTPYVPPAYREEHGVQDFERGWVQLLPAEHGVSGFFVARFEKTSDV